MSSLSYCMAYLSSNSPRIAGWPGRYINVQHYGGLSMVFLLLKVPLELFAKRREFLPGSMFLSHRDRTQAVKSDINPKNFLRLIIALIIGIKPNKLVQSGNNRLR